MEFKGQAVPNGPIGCDAMRILALETTEPIGTVAAMLDDNLLAQLDLDSQQRTAGAFAPALKALLRQVGWKPSQVELVAATIGPGSFTGLRIGLTAAKTFAYAVEAAILGVDTLETIAAAAPPEVETLSVAVDAQRGDVVAAWFQRGPDGWFEQLRPSQLIKADVWLNDLPQGTHVSGPILQKLASSVPECLRILDRQYWAPSAASVARLAAHQYAAGRRDDVWTLLPRYCRRSAAEEKWDARDEGRGARG
jgi:tRNA threonylcarbamoyladenosine biosynthesis protein TsaB